MAAISYYDNVKDSVKEKDDTGKPNFETLRKAAEEHSEDEEEKEGDGTSIEVLEDGLKDREQVYQEKEQKKQSSEKQQQSQSDTRDKANPLTSDSGGSGSTAEMDTSGIEQKLDRIIEQNQRMIEILESFGS